MPSFTTLLPVEGKHFQIKTLARRQAHVMTFDLSCMQRVEWEKVFLEGLPNNLDIG